MSDPRKRAEQLREDIAQDLRALKVVVSRGNPAAIAREAAPSVPAWVAGAVAGIMAGAWAVNRRRQTSPTRLSSKGTEQVIIGRGGG
jgi:post-segregation antitoxin (ccd killing protein)